MKTEKRIWLKTTFTKQLLDGESEQEEANDNVM